jgi:hypothetical protein
MDVKTNDMILTPVSHVAGEGNKYSAEYLKIIARSQQASMVTGKIFKNQTWLTEKRGCVDPQ